MQIWLSVGSPLDEEGFSALEVVISSKSIEEYAIGGENYYEIWPAVVAAFEGLYCCICLWVSISLVTAANERIGQAWIMNSRVFPGDTWNFKAC